MNLREQMIDFVSRLVPKERRYSTGFTEWETLKSSLEKTQLIGLDDEVMEKLAGVNSNIIFLCNKTYVTRRFVQLDLTTQVLYFYLEMKNALCGVNKECDVLQHNLRDLRYTGLDKVVLGLGFDKEIPRLTSEKLNMYITSIVLDDNEELGDYNVTMQYGNIIDCKVKRKVLDRGEIHLDYEKKYVIDSEYRCVVDRNDPDYRKYMRETKSVRALM